MKTRLLDFLACPECGSSALRLNAFATEGEEIIEGVLACNACERTYPVIGGVPRLLPDALIGSLIRYHPNYFRRHDVAPRGQSENDEVARTLTFYSYARAKLFTPDPDPGVLAYWQRSLSMRIPGVKGVRGKLGIDAGCGEGRYTYCLAERGAEVIGLDLSEAVNFAYLRNRNSPRAHVVQGSIYQPPFRRGRFDFVMSTGVLHHLPDPQRGFQALVPLVHPGGAVHVWVYGLRQMGLVYQLSHLTFLRSLGSRLSPRASYIVSVPLAVALHLALFQPLRLLRCIPRLRPRITPQLHELASLPLQMHIAEVQDRIGVPVTHFLTEDDLRRWHEGMGLGQITIEATDGGRGWSAEGRLPVYGT